MNGTATSGPSTLDTQSSIHVRIDPHRLAASVFLPHHRLQLNLHRFCHLLPVQVVPEAHTPWLGRRLACRFQSWFSPTLPLPPIATFPLLILGTTHREFRSQTSLRSPSLYCRVSDKIRRHSSRPRRNGPAVPTPRSRLPPPVTICVPIAWTTLPVGLPRWDSAVLTVRHLRWGRMRAIPMCRHSRYVLWPPTSTLPRIPRSEPLERSRWRRDRHCSHLGPVRRPLPVPWPHHRSPQRFPSQTSRVSRSLS